MAEAKKHQKQKVDPVRHRRQLAARTRTFVAQGAVSKAVQGLLGGVAEGTVDERRHWTASMIP
eukprot:1490943-Amphidinium_carterae.1